MPKVMIYVKPKFEEYEVRVYTYDANGKLIEERGFSSVKQIVIRCPEIRLSRQLFHEYIALIANTETPKVEIKEGGILYVLG